MLAEVFTERIARLPELADEELVALEDELVAAFTAADTDGDVEGMQSIADALDDVRAEIARRGSEEAAIGAEVEGEAIGEAMAEAPLPPPPASAEEALMAPASGAPAEESVDVNAESEPVTAAPEVPAEETSTLSEVPADEEKEETEKVEEVPTAPTADTATEEEATTMTEETPATEAPAEAAEESVDVNAETETPAPEVSEVPEVPEVANVQEETPEVAAEITSVDVPEENRPVVLDERPLIRAGGDIPGIPAGQELESWDTVIDAMTARVNTLRGLTQGDGERILVASAGTPDTPDDYLLTRHDSEGNAAKIRRAISSEDMPITAAVAWCAPRTPNYDVPTIGSTKRCLRDILPSFSVDRGGVVWHEPPALPSFTAALSNWDGKAAKPCMDIPCGAELTVDLNALTMCLCFDVPQSRAFPEAVRANTELALVAQARFAEQELLREMYGRSRGPVDGTPETGKALGAARDYLVALRILASNYRWVNRLDPEATLSAVAPAWLRDAIAADLTDQPPGDDSLSTSYAEIEAYIADMNVDMGWYCDSIPTAPTADEWAAIPTANLGFPTEAYTFLFTPGSYVYLDGGTLDLGVVRDKSTVQANKYCEFVETFEGLMTTSQSGTTQPISMKTPVVLAGQYGAGVDTSGGTFKQ